MRTSLSQPDQPFRRTRVLITRLIRLLNLRLENCASRGQQLCYISTNQTLYRIYCQHHGLARCASILPYPLTLPATKCLRGFEAPRCVGFRGGEGDSSELARIRYLGMPEGLFIQGSIYHLHYDFSISYFHKCYTVGHLLATLMQFVPPRVEELLTLSRDPQTIASLVRSCSRRL